MELKPCPFCKREMVLLPPSDVIKNDEPCWGHPRNTPPEECFIHSLIIYKDQFEHWNTRPRSQPTRKWWCSTCNTMTAVKDGLGDLVCVKCGLVIASHDGGSQPTEAVALIESAKESLSRKCSEDEMMEAIGELDRAVAIISAPVSRATQGWISVKDDLPEEGLLVFFCADQRGTSIGFYDETDQTWVNEGPLQPLGSVTHWMPLPAAPSGSERGEA